MSAVYAKGRFLVDAQPVPSPLARSGFIFRWVVIDFDADREYSGLAADLTCASLEACTAIKEAR